MSIDRIDQHMNPNPPRPDHIAVLPAKPSDCADCGSEAFLVLPQKMEEEKNFAVGEIKLMRVRCGYCQARGSFHSDDYIAIKKWNDEQARKVSRRELERLAELERLQVVKPLDCFTANVIEREQLAHWQVFLLGFACAVLLKALIHLSK